MNKTHRGEPRRVKGESKPALGVTVTAKCIGCGHTRQIRAGEVAAGDMPMCDKCGNVMVATKADAK